MKTNNQNHQKVDYKKIYEDLDNRFSILKFSEDKVGIYQFLINLKTWVDIKTLDNILQNLDIITPRQVNLLIENVKNTLLSNKIAREILLVDLFLIEYLKLFHHQILKYIIKDWPIFLNQDELWNYWSLGLNLPTIPKENHIIKELISNKLSKWYELFYTDRDDEFLIVKNIISFLFKIDLNNFFKQEGSLRKTNEMIRAWGTFNITSRLNNSANDTIKYLLKFIIDPFRLCKLENFLVYFNFHNEIDFLKNKNIDLSTLKEIREKIKEEHLGKEFIRKSILSAYEKAIKENENIILTLAENKIVIALWDKETLKQWLINELSNLENKTSNDMIKRRIQKFKENLQLKDKIKSTLKSEDIPGRINFVPFNINY